MDLLKNNKFTFLLFLIFWTLIFTNCSQIEKKKKKNYNEYTETKGHGVVSDSLNENISKVDISFKEFKFNIIKIEDRAYVKYSTKSTKSIKWETFFINTNYFNTKLDVLKEVHILFNIKLNDGFILFPSYSEELMTYFVYKFDKNKLKYIDDFSLLRKDIDNILMEKVDEFVFNECNYKILENRKIVNLSHKTNKGVVYNYTRLNNFPKTNYQTISDDLYKIENSLSKRIATTNTLISLYSSDEWRVACTDHLTRLYITKDEKEMYLYSDNDIYINIDIIPIANKENEFYIKFINTNRFINHYPEKKHIIDEEISKIENIAKLTLKGDKLIMEWYGLYNTKTKSIDFVTECIFVKENGDKNPIVLSKCDN